MAEAKLNGVFHIGIVVPDAKTAAEHLCQLFSLDQQSVQYIDMRQVTAEKMIVRGREIKGYNLLAIVQVGNLEFEFISYLEGDATLQKEFLNEYGAGIQHICLDVDNYEETIEKMREMGAKTILKIGESTARYMDLTESMGLVIELCNKDIIKCHNDGVL